MLSSQIQYNILPGESSTNFLERQRERSGKVGYDFRKARGDNYLKSGFRMTGELRVRRSRASKAGGESRHITLLNLQISGFKPRQMQFHVPMTGGNPGVLCSRTVVDNRQHMAVGKIRAFRLRIIGEIRLAPLLPGRIQDQILQQPRIFRSNPVG